MDQANFYCFFSFSHCHTHTHSLLFVASLDQLSNINPPSFSYLWMRTSIAETAAFLQYGEEQCNVIKLEIRIVWMGA
jgi:hypothetical protein